jgi:hypothetical protein|tara:strand:- start:2285 stop:2743 length:459 start_codon:yes stop_codon:yes gene_type:complete
MDSSVESNKLYLINLSVKELVYVDDSISTLTKPSKDENMYLPLRMSMPSNTIGAPMSLIKKIGIAVLNAFDKRGSVDLEMDESELLILRELAHSGIRDEDQMVGLGLKRKVYAALWGGRLKEEEYDDFMHDEIKRLDPDLSAYLDGVSEKEE